MTKKRRREATLRKWQKVAKTSAREQRGRRAQVDRPLAGLVRAEVQAKVREVVPGVLREEVDAHLRGLRSVGSHRRS